MSIPVIQNTFQASTPLQLISNKASSSKPLESLLTIQDEDQEHFNNIKLFAHILSDFFIKDTSFEGLALTSSINFLIHFFKKAYGHEQITPSIIQLCIAQVKLFNGDCEYTASQLLEIKKRELQKCSENPDRDLGGIRVVRAC